MTDSITYPETTGEIGEVTLNFNESKAKGSIRIERGPYGAWVYVNGQCLGLIDLFHLVPELADDGEELYPQFVINDTEDGDPAAFVKWHKQTIKVDFEDREVYFKRNDWGWPSLTLQRETEDVLSH